MEVINWSKVEKNLPKKLFHFNKQFRRLAKKVKTAETLKTIRAIKANKPAVASKIGNFDLLQGLKCLDLDKLALNAYRKAIQTHFQSDFQTAERLFRSYPALNALSPTPQTLSVCETVVLDSRMMICSSVDLMTQLTDFLNGRRPSIINKKQIGRTRNSQGGSQIADRLASVCLGDSQPGVPSVSQSDMTSSSGYASSMLHNTDNGDATSSGLSESNGMDWKQDFEETRKKNRMGQRRRRELWEKTYGMNAKHIKAQASNISSTRQQRHSKAFTEPKGSNARLGKRGNRKFDLDPVNKPQEPIDDLHPSWQAKKRKKEAITEFKGSKIVFGNDRETMNVKPSTATTSINTQEALHPSWEAKRRAKEVEAAKMSNNAKPTKIIFDD